MTEYRKQIDVVEVLALMTLEEKISILSGSGSCKTSGLERFQIPALDTSDGPHGIRGSPFFNPDPACMLPCAAAMGCTFNCDILRKAGQLLGDEARCRRVSVLLGPTVCLQRSPLIGRGFEAYAEDPVLSGLLGAQFVAGVQEKGVAACIKHFCAHDQSTFSIEDNVVMTERTLRELHLAPFQLAMRDAKPWAIMPSYNKVNGRHASESPNLLNQILREEWGFDGLVLSDWWGTYSTSEAINAGLDLEMPGPTVWRGQALTWAVQGRKVSMVAIDNAVKNVLTLHNRTMPALVSEFNPSVNNTPEARQFVRQLACESIVLLKNDESILPLKHDERKTFGLIGDHFQNAAFGGGGSSEVDPYYKVQPYDALLEVIREENVSLEVGCHSHRWAPLLWDELTIPDSDSPGLLVEFFAENPGTAPQTELLYSTTTKKSMLLFGDSLPKHLPQKFFSRITTTFTAKRTMQWRFGLSVAGCGSLFVDGKHVIDMWLSLPEKTDDTPGFNGLSMEKYADLDVKEGQKYDLRIEVTNIGLSAIVGAAPSAGARIGGYELINEDNSIAAAVDLAKKVDVPIILTGLSSDWEFEGCDRKDIVLPRRVDEMIERVLDANRNTGS